MKINSEQEMIDFGREFASYITGRVTALGGPQKYSPSGEILGDVRRQDPSGVIIELIGDIGTGKTTFTRGLAEGLGITEPITSPSFTISKTYALPNGKRLIHYDFYRLPDPGLMTDDLAENLKNPNNIIVIEWGDSVSDLLPEDHVTINFNYDNNGREVIL